jgi:endoglucanase
MRLSSRLRSLVPMLLLPFVVSACGSDGDSPTVPTTPPTPTISLTVTNPAPVPSLAIAVGAQVSIALTRTGGFTGAVTMTAEGLPAGWSASFAPAQITTGAGTLATVTVPGNTPKGNTTVTFRATATGVSAATGQATITVQ